MFVMSFPNLEIMRMLSVSFLVFRAAIFPEYCIFISLTFDCLVGLKMSRLNRWRWRWRLYFDCLVRFEDEQVV